MSRQRRFVATCNNFSLDDNELDENGNGFSRFHVLACELVDQGVFKGFMYGEEVGDNGTPHLQIYFEVENARTIRGLQKLAIFREVKCSIEIARGTVEQNRAYTTKEDGRHFEKGTFADRAGQGRRTDWHDLHALVIGNVPTPDLMEAHPNLVMPHINKVQSWRKVLRTEEREWKTRPIILYGPPGAGKSTRMRELSKELVDANDWRVYRKSDPTPWWPGYDGQEIICIDEMHGGYFQYQQLLKTLDEEPMKVQFKGGYEEFLARVIIMTTNIHPQLWYKDHQTWDRSNAFRRRIKDYGELWVYEFPTENEDGTLEFHAPRRDTELESILRNGEAPGFNPIN